MAEADALERSVVHQIGVDVRWTLDETKGFRNYPETLDITGADMRSRTADLLITNQWAMKIPKNI